MRRGLTATLVVGVILVGGCGDDGDESVAPSDAGETFPARAPDVTGRIEVEEGTVRLIEPSDVYFEGMTLVSDRVDDAVLVADEAGDPLDIAEIDDGMLVDVWVGGGCAESYPVQCAIEALRIDLGS